MLEKIEIQLMGFLLYIEGSGSYAKLYYECPIGTDRCHYTEWIYGENVVLHILV